MGGKGWQLPLEVWAKILYFVSRRAGFGLKFQFPSWTGPGSDLNFNFSFRPGWDFSHAGRAEIFFFTLGLVEILAMRARSEKSGPCRRLTAPSIFSGNFRTTIHFLWCFISFIYLKHFASLSLVIKLRLWMACPNSEIPHEHWKCKQYCLVLCRQSPWQLLRLYPA